MNRLIFTVFMVFGVLFLNSCIFSRKVVYVTDMTPDSAYNDIEIPPLRVQKGDRLSIVVRAKTPELAMPFNIDGSVYRMNERGDVGAAGSQLSSERGYQVDLNGNIDFPILGKLEVQDLSLQEVKELIYNKLIDEKLINEPLVRVELLNLKINVMGEVTRVGVLDIEENKITLLDAISQAGGLTLNGAPDKIAVIRQENGERKMIINNLESAEIFKSPTYYLKQNDIVYVMPRSGRITPREELGLRYTSLGLSVLAVILTIINLTKN